ncbi:unnamed protein product [Agarophyton chilense]|eukprot:gb/GEZJ01002863.1/.p1 GENE.gb/GEZJ01002863.1/~~gb/GEZJ01002863.1/.p1  ORF type:complete len:469 (+),score=70.62 gb/GEZJ01002863.1/:1088-2494(+)
MTDIGHLAEKPPVPAESQSLPTKPPREQWQKLMPLERLMLDESIPTKQDIITVCFTISSIIARQDLKRTILPRFLSHPRFCSTLSQRRGVYGLHHDPTFNAASPQIMSYHVNMEPAISDSLPEENQLHAFNACLNHIISTALDMNRPLWKLHVFPKWSLSSETRAKSTTIVLRVHHSIADGIGLVKYFLSRVIDSDDSSCSLLTPKSRCPQRSFFRACLETIDDMRKIATVPFFADPKTAFTQPEQNILNHCAFIPPRPDIISDLKLAAKRRDATINDVLMAAFAGAVRKYFIDMGQDVNKLTNFHTAMPFNRHVFDEFQEEDVSNQLAMLPVRLPIHVEASEERLKLCVHDMNRLKRSYQPQFALTAMGLVAALPPFLRRMTWKRLSKSASVLFSNVPGPMSTVRVGGIEVQSVYIFPPIDSNTTVNIAMFSYNNGLFVTVSGDANRLPQPRNLIGYFNDELDTYLE